MIWVIFAFCWLAVGAACSAIYIKDAGYFSWWQVLWTPLWGPLALPMILPRSDIAARRVERERLRVYDDENYQRLLRAIHALDNR
jgi:hypothetical protein